MQKRLLSLLTAALMVFSLFPFTAAAADIVDSGVCGENLTWTLDADGLLTISGAGPMADYSGENWPFYQNRESIRSIIIESGVTSIGYAAFAGCTSLTSATIPESVTSIGDHAFNSCSSLTSAAIPEGVTSIGSYAFYDCSCLTSVTIPDSVTTVGNYAFYDCSAVTSVAIPESVVSIGEYAFGGCSALTSVTIPESVMRIGKCAFIDCTSLTSVTFPDGITSIGNDLFVNCTCLTSVTIPEGVTSIGSFAFSGCSSLTSVTIPESVTSIQEYAFSDCTSLTDVYYSGTVTQWNAISIIDNNDELKNAARHYIGDYDDCPSKIFADVDNDAYYHLSLDWAVSGGVTTGVTPTTFAPNRSCTRAQVVTFLWRAQGSPEPTIQHNPFEDVNPSAYYYKAVLWALEKGVTTGLNETHFAPNNTVTRAQTVTLLWRMQGEPAPTGGVTFPDVPSNAYYARAVYWAAENGVTSGVTPATFVPSGGCTRAQAVTFLYRALAE